MAQASSASQWESIDNSTAQIFWATECGSKSMNTSHHAASLAAHASASTTPRSGSTNPGASGSAIMGSLVRSVQSVVKEQTSLAAPEPLWSSQADLSKTPSFLP